MAQETPLKPLKYGDTCWDSGGGGSRCETYLPQNYSFHLPNGHFSPSIRAFNFILHPQTLQNKPSIFLSDWGQG